MITVAADHLERTRAYLAAAEADALLVARPENRRYVTGFTGSAGLVAVTPSEALLAVDFRYYEQAESQAPACRVIRGGADPAKALADAVKTLGPARIGFESEFLPYAQVERLRERFAPAELVPLADVDRIRWVKDDAEVAAIARAGEIADAAFERLLEVLRPGMSERDAALELEIAIRRAGGERLAFDTVLASGPRGALPHGRATDRVMERGEFVTVDFGAVFDGYVSDCTRTVALARRCAPARGVRSRARGAAPGARRGSAGSGVPRRRRRRPRGDRVRGLRRGVRARDGARDRARRARGASRVAPLGRGPRTRDGRDDRAGDLSAGVGRCADRGRGRGRGRRPPHPDSSLEGFDPAGFLRRTAAGCSDFMVAAAERKPLTAANEGGYTAYGPEQTEKDRRAGSDRVIPA